METMREKAAQMLRESEVVVLTSVNKEGYPRPVPMSMVKSEDISTVWMSTGSDSVKTEDFRKNPKGGLCFYAQGNSVCMTGDVEVITDQNVKTRALASLVHQSFSRRTDRSQLCNTEIYSKPRHLLD